MRYINLHHILCTLLLLTSSTIVYAQGKVSLGLEVEPKGSATITCTDEQGRSYDSWDKVPQGTLLTITATPNAGYKIDFIWLDGVKYKDDTLTPLLDSEGRATIKHTATGYMLSYTVYLDKVETPQPKDFTITIAEPNSAHGRIAVVDFYTKEEIQDKAKVQPETIIEVTAFEYEGFEIESLQIGEKQLSRDELNISDHATEGIQYTVQSDVSIVATYKPTAQECEVTITAPDESHGRIAVVDFYTKEEIQDKAKVQPGTIIEVTAFEYEGFEIESLQIGEKQFSRDELNISDHATEGIQYTVQSDISIAATYKAKEQKASISWITPPATEGTLKVLSSSGTELNMPSTLPIGDQITIVVTPQDGYIIEGIRINTLFIPASSLTASTEGGSLYHHRLSEDVEISAAFKPITPPTYTLSFSWPKSVDTLVTATCGGKTITSGVLLHEGDEVTFSLQDNDNYIVDHWKVNGSTNAMGSPTLKLTMPNESVNVELLVKEVKKHKVSFQFNGEGGMVTALANGLVVSSGASLLEGTEITFEAHPFEDEGYTIEKWTYNGEIVNDKNPVYRVTLNADINVSVQFVKADAIPTISIDNKFSPCYHPVGQVWIIPFGKSIWQLHSISGDLIAEGESDAVEAYALPSGVYLLTINNTSYKVVKP